MEERRTIKNRIRDIIFLSNTPSSKGFDLMLLILILISVLAVMLESVNSIDKIFHLELERVEWIITILFTIEYILRIWTVRNKWAYITSFYGIVDLVSILPTYLGVILPETQYLSIVRALRLLRFFRVLKLNRYLGEGKVLMNALQASRPKITVFLFSVMTVVLLVGALMYLVEGGNNGFDSIPRSIYWAIVTITTVGYGDISPTTVLGQFIASILMIMGYGIIAVPTGIVSAEIAQANKNDPNRPNCPVCGKDGHVSNADFCLHCGSKLEE